MWNNWEQLRCVTSNPDFRNNKSNCIFIGKLWCRGIFVLGNFAWTKRLLNLSTEVIVDVFEEHPYVSFAILVWKTKSYVVLMCNQEINLSQKRKNQFQMLIEICIVQTVKTKSVYTIQPNKIVAPTAKSAQPAIKGSKIHLRDKNRQWHYLVKRFYLEDESWLRSRKLFLCYKGNAANHN